MRMRRSTRTTSSPRTPLQRWTSSSRSWRRRQAARSSTSDAGRAVTPSSSPRQRLLCHRAGPLPGDARTGRGGGQVGRRGGGVDALGRQQFLATRTVRRRHLPLRGGLRAPRRGGRPHRPAIVDPLQHLPIPAAGGEGPPHRPQWSGHDPQVIERGRIGGALRSPDHGLVVGLPAPRGAPSHPGPGAVFLADGACFAIPPRGDVRGQHGGRDRRELGSEGPRSGRDGDHDSRPQDHGAVGSWCGRRVALIVGLSCRPSGAIQEGGHLSIRASLPQERSDFCAARRDRDSILYQDRHKRNR